MTEPTPDPGARLEGETNRAYQAFRLYLEAGPARTTAKVGRELGHRSERQSQTWSSKHRWVERVAAYEAAAARTADGAHMSAIAERSARQAQIAQLHGEVTAMVSSEIARRIQQRELDLGKLSDAEVLRIGGQMARAHNRAVVTERLALGATTDQPGTPTSREEANAQAAQLSDEDLEDRLMGFDELGARREARRRDDEAEGTG